MAELSPTFNEVPPILGECSIDVIFYCVSRRTATCCYIFSLEKNILYRNETFSFLFASFRFVT